MTIRTELAMALSQVDGVTGHPYVVSHTDPGTAYVRLERLEYPNPFGGVVHLNVVLVLPQDLAAAERYLEAKAPQVHAAIEPHLHVTSLTPQRLQIDGVGALPVAFFNGYTESEE